MAGARSQSPAGARPHLIPGMEPGSVTSSVAPPTPTIADLRFEHPTSVDLVIPVCNEERALGPCVERLSALCAAQSEFRVRLLVVDNGSSDATWEVLQELMSRHSQLAGLRLPERGRGRALVAAWSASQAELVAYTDVDLSTDLDALLPLLRAVSTGGAELATGSRLLPGSEVSRSRRRELLSRGYNLLLRGLLQLRVRDAQCGFKAGRRSSVQMLLPRVRDRGWFFDTELLVRAQWAGVELAEIPVRWVEDADSRVRVVPTILSDLVGIWRLWREAGREGRGALPLGAESQRPRV